MPIDEPLTRLDLIELAKQDARDDGPTTGRPDLTVAAVTDRWTRTAGQLRPAAASPAGAVHALASYPDELTGTGGDG